MLVHCTNRIRSDASGILIGMGVPVVPELVFSLKGNPHAVWELETILNGCVTFGRIADFEKGLTEGWAKMREEARPGDKKITGVEIKITQMKISIAKRKNELAKDKEYRQRQQ